MKRWLEVYGEATSRNILDVFTDEEAAYHECEYDAPGDAR